MKSLLHDLIARVSPAPFRLAPSFLDDRYAGLAAKYQMLPFDVQKQISFAMFLLCARVLGHEVE